MSITHCQFEDQSKIVTSAAEYASSTNCELNAVAAGTTDLRCIETNVGDAGHTCLYLKSQAAYILIWITALNIYLVFASIAKVSALSLAKVVFDVFCSLLVFITLVKDVGSDWNVGAAEAPLLVRTVQDAQRVISVSAQDQLVWYIFQFESHILRSVIPRYIISKYASSVALIFDQLTYSLANEAALFRNVNRSAFTGVVLAVVETALISSISSRKSCI